MKKFKIKNILVPTDFSKTAGLAVEHAQLMARLFNAKIHLLHVVQHIYPVSHDGLMMPANQFHSDMRKHAKKAMKRKIHDLLLNYGVRAKAAIKTGSAHAEINDYAKRNDIDIIIMGTHGVSGWKEFFAESNTYRVVNDSPCPVITINKKSKLQGYKNIILPIRDIQHSREKVDYAVKIAKQYNSKIHLVFYTGSKDESVNKKMKLIKHQAEKYLAAQNVSYTSKNMTGKDYFDALIRYGKSKKADLIFIMAQRSRGISQLFSGPYAQQFVNRSRIPVFCVPVYFKPELVRLWQFSSPVWKYRQAHP